MSLPPDAAPQPPPPPAAPPRPSRPGGLGLFACFLAIGTLLAMVQLSTRPPPVAPKWAPPEAFSAATALSALEAAIGPLEPRPPGSLAHARARAGLAAALSGLGFVVEERDTLLDGAARDGVVRVRNLVGRREGATDLPALVLAAHYDSVPAGPGAADDGAGLATILGVARALGAGPPLRRDLLVVVTDGEESGLYGARAFVAERERYGALAGVVNLEARGAGGPTHVFEVAPGAAWPPLLRSLRQPLATSVAAEVYRRMPNDTDYSVYAAAGLVGFNLAFLEDWPAYHSPADDLARLDPGSVQHMGADALALLRAMDAAELPGDPGADPQPPPGGPTDPPDRPTDPVYTDLLARWVLVLPLWALRGLAGLAVAGALVGVGAGVRDGRMRLGGVVAGVALALGALVAGAITSTTSVSGVAGPEPWHAWQEGVYVTSWSAALLAWALVTRIGGAALGGASRSAGTALVLAVAGAWLASEVPGAAHLLVLPGLVAAGVAPWWGRREAALAVSLVAGLLLFPVAIALVEVVGVAVPAAVMAPLLLVVAPLAPEVAALRPRSFWPLVVAVGLVAAIGVVGAARWPTYDDRRPGTRPLYAAADSVTLGNGRAALPADVEPARLAAALPAPTVACGADGALRVTVPDGTVHVDVIPTAPGEVRWAARALPLVARLRMSGVDAGEAGGFELVGGGSAEAPPRVRVERRGDFAALLGVDRGRGFVTRHGGDSLVWEGPVACPPAAGAEGAAAEGGEASLPP